MARRGIPTFRRLWRERTALQVGFCHSVVSHHARTCTGLNSHVAHTHTAFHRQRGNSLAAKFNRVARAAGRADSADDGED